MSRQANTHLDRETPVFEPTWDVLRQIITSIGQIPAESGGPIGGNDGDACVNRFHFDEKSRASSVTYSPDYQLLNRLFQTAWNPQGVRLRGFVHSHPGRMGRPSTGDEVYAERILDAIEDLEWLWLPIVYSLNVTYVAPAVVAELMQKTRSHSFGVRPERYLIDEELGGAFADATHRDGTGPMEVVGPPFACRLRGKSAVT